MSLRAFGEVVPPSRELRTPRVLSESPKLVRDVKSEGGLTDTVPLPVQIGGVLERSVSLGVIF